MPNGIAVTRRQMLSCLPAIALGPHALGRRLLGQAAPAPLRVLGITHVTLAVADVARSVAFYQGLFGLPVQARHGDAVLLRLGDGPRFLKLVPAEFGGPTIDHFGLSVEDFEVGRVLETLAALGVGRAIGGEGLSGGPMRVRISTRDGTPELFMGDPDGLVTQLQSPSYCGGGGLLGEECTAEPAPAGAPLPLRGFSHLTINPPSPDASIEFYRRTFGLDIQTYQAAAPVLGVGPGTDFLMFTGGGASAGPRTARINHACMTLEAFDVARIQRALEAHGVRPRPESPAGGAAARGPLLHWISMRMPNRGGAPEGTPELYFSDPDGLVMQLQDVSYCGGGGRLGEVC